MLERNMAVLLIICSLVFGSFSLANARQGGGTLTCRDIETGYIHVRYQPSPFGLGGTLEITESALGGDLVLSCDQEQY